MLLFSQKNVKLLRFSSHIVSFAQIRWLSKKHRLIRYIRVENIILSFLFDIWKKKKLHWFFFPIDLFMLLVLFDYYYIDFDFQRHLQFYACIDRILFGQCLRKSRWFVKSVLFSYFLWFIYNNEQKIHLSTIISQLKDRQMQKMVVPLKKCVN